MPNPNDNTLPTPPTPQPPAPPAGAMDKGVTGADPANDPTQSLMAEATRLGGPLGGIAIGAATGAAHHIDSQNQPSPSQPSIPKWAEGLTAPSSPNASPSATGSTSTPSWAEGLTGPSKVAGIDTPITDPDEYSDPATGMTVSQMADPRTLKMGAAVTGAMAAAPIAPAVAGLVPEAIAGSTLLGSMAGGAAGGAAAGGTQSVVSQVMQHENPFREQMRKETEEQMAVGGVLGAAAPLAGKVAGAVINKGRSMFTPGAEELAAETPKLASATEEAGLPPAITEQHLTHVPEEQIPVPQHGAPYKSDQPFDNATIANMRQGRTLSTDETNLLKEYVGDTVRAGSTPKNTAMGAVKPVNETLDRLGHDMNLLIHQAPDFELSTIEDPEIGTSLREDLQNMRENFPRGASDTRGEIVETQMADANKALVSNDPKEILKARRDLGDNIDWDTIKKNPDTDGEVTNTVRARIYKALSDKLKAIDGVIEKPDANGVTQRYLVKMADLDKEFQPNLELKGWLKKILPEGVADDPVEAEAQRMGEFAKGRTKLAIEAHNARVDENLKVAKQAVEAHEKRINKNWATAGKIAVGAGIGTGLVKGAESILPHVTP